jgi:hypothetical protein
MSQPYDRQSFPDFLADLKWRQGEHVLIAAPTGAGKTTLVAELAHKRRYVTILASKPDDDALAKRFRDYYRTSTWPAPAEENRILLWPRRGATLSENIERQRVVFKKALDSMGRNRGWCIVVDEAHWCSQFLRLDKEIAVLHHQGRSSGISMVVCTQRPAWIPRIIYSSASHVFLGSTQGDAEDARALSALGGVDKRQVMDALATMPKHDLLYINPMGSAAPRIINTRR